MKASYIIDILKRCELLDGFDFGVDFVDLSDNYVCIKCKNSDKIIRRYCDGENVMGYEFSVIIKFSSKERNNALNTDFCERLAAWILELNKEEFVMGEGFLPVKISLINGPTSYEDSAKSIKYKMDLRFDYIKL